MTTMDNQYKLVLNTPASWYKSEWKDALPTGNGLVGASVYGAVKDETILVNHYASWHWGQRTPVPDVSASLKITRDLIKEKKYAQANGVSSKMLIEGGYKEELYKPCPIGDIKIHMEHEKPFSKYQRSLDMETGEVALSYHCNGISYRRTTFVSRSHNVIVCKLEADKKQMAAQVYLQLHRTSGEDYGRMLEEVKDGCSYEIKEDILCFTVATKDRSFGLLGKVIYSDGAANLYNNKIHIKEASQVILVFEPFANEPFAEAFQRFQEKLQGIPANYKDLYHAHSELHKPLFHTANFHLEEEKQDILTNEELLLDSYKNDVSNTLIEKLWHYGRYLFISGTSEEGYPFALYGLWGGEYDLLWSHNMANINIQMIYWHALLGGYTKYLKAVIHYYYDLMGDFKENAKQIFGLNGIWVSAGTTPGYGVANQVVPVIMNWIGGAGWICQHFYEYYKFTGDEVLLKEKILPFMLEAAQFYEEYLILEDGQYVIVPSVSPENTPGNLNTGEFKHMSHACPTAKNATMDIAIIKELLHNLLTICEGKDIYVEKCKLWRDILDKIPAYEVNEENAIKEWTSKEFTDFYYHRHLSHTYPVFPGNEITKEKDPQLYKAFIRAMELRVLGGQSGWSLTHMACLNARFERGEDAYEYLNILSKACLTASFLSLHNDWRKMGLTLDMSEEFKDEAPVQLDANMGLVGAVQEMLLYHFDGVIRLLPAIPSKWRKGIFSDFHLQKGLISCEWDRIKEEIKVIIFSKEDQNLKIYLPDFIKNKAGEINGQPLTELGPHKSIELDCKQNETITLYFG